MISVGLLPSEGADDFKVKFLEAIDGLEDFTVFADLMGGTPCNVVSRLILEGAHFDLYAGMNMPMVIGFLNSQLLGEAVDYKEFAIENTHKVNDLLMAFADDDED
ncbi:PTS fructose transporter subunit IIA [Streptococcus iniae]